MPKGEKVRIGKRIKYRLKAIGSMFRLNRKRKWMIFLILFLIVIGILLLLIQVSAVAPFIYTIF